MKKISFLILFLLIVFSAFMFFKNKEVPTPEEENPASSYMTLENISSDQAGIFKLGSTIPDEEVLLKAGYSVEETTEFPEGMEQKVYVVSRSGEQILTFDLLEFLNLGTVVADISVTSPRFKTNEGIVVGSTVSEFIKAYPNYTIWYTAEEGEKFILNTTKEAITPQFFLERSGLVDSEKSFYNMNSKIKISDFKTDAEITKIRIYYHP